MRYGTGMGLLWAFKFMLFPLGLRIPFLQLLFIVLTIGVPFLGYIFINIFLLTLVYAYLSDLQNPIKIILRWFKLMHSALRGVTRKTALLNNLAHQLSICSAYL